MKRSIKLGLAPTRRFVFSAEDARRYKGLVEQKLRDWKVEFVTIDSVTKEGLLFERRDAVAGVPGAIASVPDGMASAVLVGVNPVYGLYASMAGPIAGDWRPAPGGWWSRPPLRLRSRPVRRLAGSAARGARRRCS